MQRQKPEGIEARDLAFNDKFGLFNAVLVVSRKSSVMNDHPVIYDNALRMVLTLRRLIGENKGKGFSDISDCYLEHVNIPAHANEHDRMNSAWSWCDSPSTAYMQDDWFIRHYGLQVMDSETITAEDSLMQELSACQHEFEAERLKHVFAGVTFHKAFTAAEDDPNIDNAVLRIMRDGAFTGMPL